MKCVFTRLFAVVLLIFSGVIEAELRFKRYTSEHGLPQLTINDALEDKYGFIWLATSKGVSRFDGNTFKTFKQQTGDSASLSENLTSALAHDNHGNIWVGTISGGLNLFDQASERFRRFNDNQSSNPQLPAMRINALSFVSEHELWIGFNGQVGVMDTANAPNYALKLIELPKAVNGSMGSRYVTDIIADGRGGVWIATDGAGLYYYHLPNKTFKHFVASKKCDTTIADNTIYDIYLDHHANLWFATANGLSRLAQNSSNFVTFKHDPDDYKSLSSNKVSSITQDSENRFWVGTFDGLNLLDSQTGKFSRHQPDIHHQNSLSSELVSKVVVTAQNVLVVGTFDQGFNVTNLGNEPFNIVRSNSNNPDSISGSHIRALAQSYNGNLWLGSENAGVSYYDPSAGKALVLKHDKDNANSLTSNHIYALLEHDVGQLWVGTLNEGLDFVDLNTNQVTNFQFDANNPNSISHNRVNSIFKDANGTVWVTTRSGLNRFVPQKQHFIRYDKVNTDGFSLANLALGAMFQSDADTLWFASVNGGLIKLDLPTEQFTQFTHSVDDTNSIMHNNVVAISSAGKGKLSTGKLWISTIRGIDRFDIATGTFEHFLPLEHSVYSAYEVDGFLWISHFYGIYRVDIATKTMVHLTADDGLQGNTFIFDSSLKTDDGKLVFGGTHGLNYFDPQTIKYSQQPPNVRLTGLQLFNKPVSVSARDKPYYTLTKAMHLLDELVLSYQQNIITVSFSALQMVRENGVHYQYRLNDDSWTDTLPNQASATYTNLDYSGHLLQVRAKLTNSAWGPVTTFPIVVTPPPWRSWWAYSLYVLVVTFIVADFFYQRHLKFKAIEQSSAQLAELNANLDHLVMERTSQLCDTLEQLKTTQGELVESKKMEALVGVVVGVAHEMNTPLGVVTTALSKLKIDLEDITDKFLLNQLSRKHFEKFSQSGQQALAMANRNVHRSAVLVAKFKALSEQKTHESRQNIPLHLLLADVVSTERCKLEHHNMKVNYECLQDLYLNTFPQILRDILAQLIENALLHSQVDDEPVTITISAFLVAGEVHIVFTDNGQGAQTRQSGTLFDPFYTTKRGSDCTGLGLSIVYNQVTQHLGGSISYTSTTGAGLTLEMVFEA